MRRVWADQDVTAIDELFKPTGLARGLGQQSLVGPEQFKVFHKTFSTLLRDFHINIDHFIEQGEWVSALVTLSAYVQSSGKPVYFTGNLHGVINNGKIEKAFNHWDFMGLFIQMDLLPKDTFNLGISGQAIV